MIVMAPDTALLTISTDVVMFSIRNERLEVLLVGQDHEGWKLPGGCVAVDEDLDSSALRHLEEQTRVKGVYLEQLYTFGRPDRHPRRRIVSVAYYALIPIQELYVQTSAEDDEPYWFPFNDLPPMALDHDQIVALAHRRLAAKLAYTTIALQFMPERFTLSALQGVFETILDERLDKRNFRKRILAMDCIEATDEVCREGHHRPARLYRAKHPGKIELIK